ncbi:MAG: hypothetical protein RL375_2238, partial [Pseudomonadota bacterium]
QRGELIDPRPHSLVAARTVPHDDDTARGAARAHALAPRWPRRVA